MILEEAQSLREGGENDAMKWRGRLIHVKDIFSIVLQFISPSLGIMFDGVGISRLLRVAFNRDFAF